MRTKTQFDPETQIWYGEKIEKRLERNCRVSLGKAALDAMGKHMGSLAQVQFIEFADIVFIFVVITNILYLTRLTSTMALSVRTRN